MSEPDENGFSRELGAAGQRTLPSHGVLMGDDHRPSDRANIGGCHVTDPSIEKNDVDFDQVQYAGALVAAAPAPLPEFHCARCDDWARMGLSSSCPSCDAAMLKAAGPLEPSQ